MNEKDYQILMDALKRQQDAVKSDKKAARKLSTEVGLIDILVPKTPKKNQ